MGSACCVAARDRTLPGKSNVQDLQRNTRYSASRRSPWDHQGLVTGDIWYPSPQLQERLNEDSITEMNDRSVPERARVSAAGSPLLHTGGLSSQKSSSYEGFSLHPISHSDASTPSRRFAEVKSSESPEIGVALPDKLPSVYPSSSSFSTPSAGPFYSHRQLVSSSTTPSRLIRHSPGHQLFRQVSDGRFQGLKSPNSNSLSEGRPSFVLSTVSNDLAAGSHGGSSDGWSLRTFSELVASSRRERWSFDSARFGSGRGKISGPSSRFSSSPSLELQNCGACSRPLTERISVFAPELSVVAVLACAHAFHAGCLETMTAEVDKYDPTCPVCAVGEKQFSKMSRKALRAEAESKLKFQRTSRNRVMDSHFDGDFDASEQVSLQRGKLPEVEASSSSKGLLGKQFFRRHFSLRSKWDGSASGSRSSKKAGFWPRNLRS
ncbi:hypothetical protein Droror1_Dr00007535 [Drosera rotundifolia]